MDILPYLDEILIRLSGSPTFLLVAPTGSGKSVALPSGIASSSVNSESGPSRVRVTVPTRAAAVGLYTFQKKLMSSQPSISVGYAAESEVNYTEKTTIAYVTTGHMRKKMLSMFRYFNNDANPIEKRLAIFKNCDALMVDEIHAGTLDNDVLLGMWSKAYSLGIPVPRLIVASATPAVLDLKPYPSRYDVSIKSKVVTEISEGRSYPISDSKGHLYIKAGEAAIRYSNEMSYMNDNGHIIVFVPGKKEVSMITEYLEKQMTTPAVIIGLTGQSDATIINQAIGDSPIRKIIVATNVAETSITVKDLAVVIDTLSEKRAETAANGGLRLVTTYISKDSAKQRRGRTGRTRNGIYHYMATEEDYNNLEDHRPPEVTRVPLHNHVLELLEVGLDPQEIMVGAKPGSITDSIHLINKLGMFVDGVVTNKGMSSVQFPLAIKNASVLYDWIKDGNDIYQGLVVMALVDCYNGGYFYVPPAQELELAGTTRAKYTQQFFGRFEGDTMLHTIINLWIAFTKEAGALGDDKAGVKRIISQWCAKNSINNKKFGEVFTTIKEVSSRLPKDRKVVFSEINTNALIKKISPYFQRSYNEYKYKNKKYIDERGLLYSCRISNPPEYIIPLATMETGNEKFVTRMIDLFIESPQSSSAETTNIGSVYNLVFDKIKFNHVSLQVEYLRYNTFKDSLMGTLVQTNGTELDHVLSFDSSTGYSGPLGVNNIPSKMKAKVNNYLKNLEDNLVTPNLSRVNGSITIGKYTFPIDGKLYSNLPIGHVAKAMLRHKICSPEDYMVIKSDDFNDLMETYPLLTQHGVTPFNCQTPSFYTNHIDTDAMFGGRGHIKVEDRVEILTNVQLTQEEVDTLYACNSFVCLSMVKQPLMTEVKRQDITIYDYRTREEQPALLYLYE